jgi:hypothetical protein
VPLTVTFRRRMQFFGRAVDPRGRPAAKAEFFEDVHAWTDDASLDCEEVMRLYLDRTVKLARLKPPETRGGEDAAGKGQDDRADVALIECVKSVVIVNRKRDPDGRLVQKQRIVGDDWAAYERATGKFAVRGAGEVFLYEREGQGQGGLNLKGPGTGRGVSDLGPPRRRIVRTSAPVPAPGRPATPPVVGRNSIPNAAGLAERARARVRQRPPLVLTQIFFTDEMHGRFGTGRSADAAETRFADFFGDVEVLRARVPDGDAVLDPDNRPDDAVFMTARTVQVISEPARDPDDADAPPRYLMRAWDNAFAADSGRTIQSDRMTFDSQSNTFYAYGEDDQQVLITQSEQFGQAPTVVPGRAAMYNIKTGQSQIVEPRSIAFFDPRSGDRPAHVKPPKDKTKEKRPPRLKFRNVRGSIERKDFTGR